MSGVGQQRPRCRSTADKEFIEVQIALLYPNFERLFEKTGLIPAQIEATMESMNRNSQFGPDS